MPPPAFTVGGTTLTLISGAVVGRAGLLELYVSDQPDTCLAIRGVPVGTMTLLALRASPPADGTTTATVTVSAPPTAGQAVGELSQRTGGVLGSSRAAANGSVAWAAGPGSATTITALDVGFAGTSDRIATGGLVLAPCAL